MTKAAKNSIELVEAGVAMLQQMGWSEDRIVAVLPMMAAEAVKILADKARLAA